MKREELRNGRAYVFQSKHEGNKKEKVVVIDKDWRTAKGKSNGMVLVRDGGQTRCVPFRDIKGPYYIGGKPQL